jgi:hypothetical protein
MTNIIAEKHTRFLPLSAVVNQILLRTLAGSEECHSERSEESLIIFEATLYRNIQSCFASLNMTGALEKRRLTGVCAIG